MMVFQQCRSLRSRAPHTGAVSIVALGLILVASSPVSAQTATPVASAAAATAAQPLPVTTPRPAGFVTIVTTPFSKCHSCWKNSTLRKLLKNGMAPVNAVTGGLIGGGHDQPPPPVAAVAPVPPPPPPAVTAAAKIKLEAAQSAARVDAVRYLATVDCHWYPEAEAGLISSLRADRSECVRLAAAEALGRGCCCTKKTIAALQIAAAGSNADGNPGERCPRVRWAALAALQTCLLQCNAAQFEQPAFEERPEAPLPPLAASDGDVSFDRFYQRVDAIPAERLLLDAHRTCAKLASGASAPVAPQQEAPRSFYAIWKATKPPTEQAAPVVTPDPAELIGRNPVPPATSVAPSMPASGQVLAPAGGIRPASAYVPLQR